MLLDDTGFICARRCIRLPKFSHLLQREPLTHKSASVRPMDRGSLRLDVLTPLNLTTPLASRHTIASHSDSKTSGVTIQSPPECVNVNVAGDTFLQMRSIHLSI